MVLRKHGLINWAGDAQVCYDLTLRLTEKAAAFIEAKRTRKTGRSGGAKYAPPLPEAESATKRCSPTPALVARPDLAGETVPGHGAGPRRRHPAFREQPGRSTSGGDGHLVRRALSSHQDQAALRVDSEPSLGR